jgi:histidine triad (HIT) family protein
MDCVFCRLIRDDTATWIARGPSTCAFAPLTAIAPGHTLVVRTAHVTDVFDAAPHVLAQSMALVRRVADAMRSALGAEGVNILNASGQSSEQSVPHLHFHVIPRWAGDNFSTWPTVDRSTTSRATHPAASPPLSPRNGPCGLQVLEPVIGVLWELVDAGSAVRRHKSSSAFPSPKSAKLVMRPQEKPAPPPGAVLLHEGPGRVGAG